MILLGHASLGAFLKSRIWKMTFEKNCFSNVFSTILKVSLHFSFINRPFLWYSVVTIHWPARSHIIFWLGYWSNQSLKFCPFQIFSSLVGMSTFRFFWEQTFWGFLSCRKKMYFVSFSFLNSKKSKDSFIVY